MTAQERLSKAMFDLHSAAQDAANEPSRESINAVRDAWRKVERLIGAFYFERMEAERTER